MLFKVQYIITIPLNTCACSIETLLNLGNLHVNAIQSPVHYYQIYKKKNIVVMGIEPGTYALNHNISVVLPYFMTLQLELNGEIDSKLFQR